MPSNVQQVMDEGGKTQDSIGSGKGAGDCRPASKGDGTDAREQQAPESNTPPESSRQLDRLQHQAAAGLPAAWCHGASMQLFRITAGLRSRLAYSRSCPLAPAAVASVKFDKASSAAAAMEELNGATLNNGRGSKIKVLLAEAPAPR